MAGIVVTVNSVNITSYVDVNSIVVEEIGTALVATCQFNVRDHSGTVSIATKHSVDIDDDGVTLFAGEVVEVGEGQRGLTKTWRVICQDNAILLDETVVVAETYAGGTSDQSIIQDLFSTYRADITTGGVAEIDSSMEEVSFIGMTLRECLDDICQRTGGRYYVDYDKDLHYFSTEAGSASFSLSSSPNMSTSFPFGGFRRTRSAAQLADYIYVLGQGESGSGWHPSAPSYAIGERHAVSRDMRITTAQGVTDRGTALIDRYGAERVSYELWTERDGLRAGESITLVNEIWSINSSFYIRKVRMEVLGKDGEKRRYHLSLNDEGVEPAKVARQRVLNIIGHAEIVVNNTMPVAARGWSHDMVFSATDWNTVAWASGTITLAGGVTTYSIGAGSTGNISQVTYIYLDTAVSVTALQTTTTAANAIGLNRILIGVAAVGDETEPVDAAFNVFGGGDTDDLGIFIHGNNLAANSITANEIAANSITAAEILAGTITAAEIAAATITGDLIAANTITAEKLTIGESLFSGAYGILLIGPNSEIAEDGWYSTRRHKATIAGAFHQEAGRWMGTRGLVVEGATTNLCKNPSFETNTTTWSVTAGSIARSSAQALYGGYSLLVDPTSSGDGAIYTCTDTTSASTEYTWSVWVRAARSGGDTIRLTFYDANGGSQYEDFAVDQDTWTRLESTRTFGTGAARDVRVYSMNGADFYVDGAQIEASGYVTMYCDGAQGSGYAWSGTAHASTSTRTATTVDLDAHVDLISGSNIGPTRTFRIVAQMPYDADEVWPTVAARLFDTRGASDDHRIFLKFDYGDDRFELWINGAYRIVTAAQTFKAGDWVDLVVTLDFSSDSYVLYVDGVSAGTDATSLSRPTLTDWQLGNDYNGGSQGGFVIAEYAVFESVLTAAQVAQMYNLQRPLVDAGSTDLPGIYILDGKFRIASSTTGNRIEITAEEIAGYNAAGVKQFYLRSEDGAAMCGGGDVTFDALGICITTGSGSPNWVRWDAGSVTRGSIYTNYSGSNALMYIYAGPAGSGGAADITLECQDAGGAGTGIALYMSSTGSGVLTVSIVGSEEFRVNTNGIRTSGRVEFGGSVNYLYESGGNIYWHNSGGDTQLN